MAAKHFRFRAIDGVLYRCQDIGCDNFDKAENNRKRIKEKACVEAYIIAERILHSRKAKLPAWMIGTMPGAKEARVLGKGFHEELATVGLGLDTG